MVRERTNATLKCVKIKTIHIYQTNKRPRCQLNVEKRSSVNEHRLCKVLNVCGARYFHSPNADQQINVWDCFWRYVIVFTLLQFSFAFSVIGEIHLNEIHGCCAHFRKKIFVTRSDSVCVFFRSDGVCVFRLNGNFDVWN